MTLTAITHELKTGDITVISNVTSVTATCNRISRLETIEEGEPTAIHVDFVVKPHQKHLPSVLEETEELGLILSADDAIELGSLLIAMGLEDKSSQEANAIFEHLFRLASDLHK